MNSVTILGSIALVHLLAIASPGPTFALVVSQTMSRDRLSGVLLTLGVVLATLTWAVATAAGLGTLLAAFPWTYRAMQIAGAAYLLYFAFKLLLGVFRDARQATSRAEPAAVSGWQAVRAGFLTNISNPKVIVYYASLFGVVIPADAPRWLFWASVLVVLTVSATWWLSVTLFFTIPAVARGFARIRPIMDVIMAAVLIALGLRLAIYG